ncbi:tigger transposable element-derived protein 2-like [Copidosoma floridanum]|uniref:tigger transposable element-derived protein 2-like n=1 Tax=Copidosoma floridanum TaxID=29053 RepID=UPI0006C974B0|nr:tigger transposable element-derived protein 2-like [Copidosoma floridanum]
MSKTQVLDDFAYKPALGYKSVFTAEQKKYMCDKILENEARLHGFTQLEVRRLGYTFAQNLNIPNRFKNDTQKPEPTSAARASGFNKRSIDEFYKILKSAYDQYDFDAQNIYNVDQTGVSCNPKSQAKVVALKGKRQVGSKVSAERGTTVTACICFSASGKYMPPMLIFPRKNENPRYLEGKQQDSWAEFNGSGWMEEKVFTKWLERFIHFSNASTSNQVLLLLDGHATHVKNLDAIKLAQSNGVVMICFPPHCTHKIQPLDVSYMKPLRNFYTAEVNKWMREHPQCTIGLKDIFSIFTPAFLKASCMATAVNAFRKTGIFPFNPEVFTEDDFVASKSIGSIATTSSGENAVTSIQALTRE